MLCRKYALWEQAGAGIIPVVLALWISSVALKGVVRWLAATTDRLQVSEGQTLISNYVVRLRVLAVHFQPHAEVVPTHMPFTAGRGLRTAWFALENL